jgi:predicted nucleic acid-binding Zn ribbon protein
MRRTNSEAVGNLIRQFLRQQGLEAPLNEYRLLQSWEHVMGPIIARYTKDLTIRNQTLYVQLNSPVIRQELHMQRRELTARLNAYVGAQVIADIVFR